VQRRPATWQASSKMAWSVSMRQCIRENDISANRHNFQANSIIDEVQLTGPAITQTTLFHAVGTQTSDTAADSSDDDSCDSEIKPSTKRYVKKLLLRHGLLTDSDLNSSASDSDSIVVESDSSDNESVIMEQDLSKLVKIPTESSASEEDICTSHNWKLFLSFQKRVNRNLPSHLCPPAEFEDSETTDTKALTLTKFRDGPIELAINSTYLQKQFRKLVDIEQYHNVLLLSSKLLLAAPFGPLYHHVDDMKAIVAEDSNVAQTERNNMDALYYFVCKGWPAKLYEDVRSKISEGFIIYDEIWALFRPGDIVISEDPIGQFELSRVESVKLEQEPHRSGYTMLEHRWYVTLVGNTWHQRRFKRASIRCRIEKFAGSKKITDLDFYPLSHHDTKTSVREFAIQRGKSWKKYCEGDPLVMSYQGQAQALYTRGFWPSPPPSRVVVEGTNQREHSALFVSSIAPSRLKSLLTNSANFNGHCRPGRKD
jgi:hypothetical protein